MLTILGSCIVMIFCAFVFGVKCIQKLYNHLVYGTSLPPFLQDVFHIAKIGLIGFGILVGIIIIIAVISSFISDK